MVKKRPVNIGHRGHELCPENTLESFRSAIECGAEMLELDVWLSADAVPVVYHDEFLISRDKKRERIAQHTAAALEKIELPGGARIPTLENVFKEVLPHVPLNIELKFFDLNYRRLVSAVIDLIRKAKAERKVLVSSFFHQSLEVVNWEEPTIATAPIFGVPTGPPHRQDLEKLARLSTWQSLLGFRGPAAVVDYLMLNEEVISEFRRSKLSVVAYTVDEREDMRKMAKLGVDGIITKRPTILREVLDELQVNRP